MLRPFANNTLFFKRFNSDKFIISVGSANFSSQSVPAIQNLQDSYEKQLKEFQKISNVTHKVRTKQPQKPPFVKNFLLGKFDSDILTYPQLDKEDTNNLQDNIKLVKNLMKQNNIKEANTVSKKFRQNLSDLRLLGLQAPVLMDGRACNVTESLTYLEALSENHLRNSILHNEQLGIQALNKYGNDQLKIKYLTKLISGDMLSAMCFAENHNLESGSFSTKAKESSDGKYWILNGQKTCVVNALTADVFIVFAVSKVISKDIVKDIRLTAFLVDKDFPGISIEKLDARGIEIANVNFNDTPIPSENVIGELHKGQAVLISLINDSRLSIGPMCIAVSKSILNNLVTEIISKADDKNLLLDTDSIRQTVGEMAIGLYAMESVVFLTSGLIDNYTDQDVEVESIFTKVFASEQTMKSATKTLDMVGLSAVSDSHWLHPLYQEAIRFKTLNEPDDSLKIIGILLSLQYAGKDLNEYINKIRNPLFHAGFAIRRIWTDRRNIEDNPKLDLRLADNLHPSLMDGSLQLEYCIKRIDFATKILLARHGPEITNYHMDLKRLADSVMDAYVMTACLGRASRSYCIGLQNSDMEIMLATAFCSGAMERVKYNVHKIYGGYYHTNDQNYRHFSKRIFKFKEYMVKHPLTRNF